MRHVEPGKVSIEEVQALLLGGVAPRPIALVSTVSPEGFRNLSPFSFFNAFGANPPTVAFSPSRRVRDASTKHTLRNLMATKECVIQAVTYPMVQQVSLASTEYPDTIDEFVKSGFTPVPSDLVKPPRVAESPFQMECKLVQVIPLGDDKGSGNLAVCEVLKFHVAEDLFVNDRIDPDRIDLVARMGGDYYCRARGEAVFWVKKPGKTRGIGIDSLPRFIRSSDILTGNNLGQLGGVESIPSSNEIAIFRASIVPLEGGEQAFYRYQLRREYAKMLGIGLHVAQSKPESGARLVMLAAKCALDSDDVEFGWKAALIAQQLSQ